jgi:isopenicillin-N N-acyltransferase-like protein
MNWDWIAETAETGLLLEARQDEGPSFVSLTEAGLLAKVGMNSAGIGLVANSVLTELDRGRPSVPLQVLLRAVFDCETVPQVLTALQRAERSASCNYMIAHEDGLAIDVEGSAGDYSQIWLGYPRDGVMLHTNHFVNPGFDGRDVSVYAMPSSPTRLQRLHQLVDARADEPLEARFFMEALGDHAMYPHSVCSHEDPRQAEEPRSATLASMILDVSARKMWFAPGSPCSTPFEEIDYSELLHSSSPG